MIVARNSIGQLKRHSVVDDQNFPKDKQNQRPFSGVADVRQYKDMDK